MKKSENFMKILKGRRSHLPDLLKDDINECCNQEMDYLNHKGVTFLIHDSEYKAVDV